MNVPDFNSRQWVQAIIRYERARGNRQSSPYEGSRGDFDRAVASYRVDPAAQELIDHFIAITVETVAKRLKS